jgi:N-acetyl-anhydromuramyl-L-alanine amidase AmpD
MGDPTTYLLELPSGKAPAPFKIPESIYPDIAWFNANRATSRTFHPVNGIEGVVIHATAGGSTAGAISHWQKPGVEASAHWIVPDEDEAGHGKAVLAVVYESLAAWHVRNAVSHPSLGNRTRINHWTLGIEVVNRQVVTDSFSDWQIEITALLVRYCWGKYPNLKYVFSHALVDPERRSDPGRHFDWPRFTSLVLSVANDPPADPATAALVALVAEDPGFTNLGPGESCCM